MQHEDKSSLEKIQEDYFSNWSLYGARLKEEATHRDAFITLALGYLERGFWHGTIYAFNADTFVKELPKYWIKQPEGAKTLEAQVNVGSYKLGLFWTESVLITRKGGFLRTYNLPRNKLAREIWLVKYLPLLEGGGE